MDNTFKDLREYTENAKVNALGFINLFTGATEHIFPKWTYQIEKTHGINNLVKGCLYRYTERDIKPVPVVLFEWLNEDTVYVKRLYPIDGGKFNIAATYSFNQNALMTYELYEWMFGVDADMVHGVVESMLHPLKIS